MNSFEPDGDIMTRHEIWVRMNQQEAILTSSRSLDRQNEAADYLIFLSEATDFLDELEEFEGFSNGF